MRKLLMVTICCMFLSSVSYAINVSHIILRDLTFVYDPGQGCFGKQFNDYQVYGECLVTLPAKTWYLGTVLLTRIDGGPTAGKDYYIARNTNGTYLGYLVGPDNGQLIGAINLDGVNSISANWSVTLSSNAGMFEAFKLVNHCASNPSPVYYNGSVEFDTPLYTINPYTDSFENSSTQTFNPNYSCARILYEELIPGTNVCTEFTGWTPYSGQITKYRFKEDSRSGLPLTTTNPVYIIPEWECVTLTTTGNSPVYGMPNFLSNVKSVENNREQCNWFQVGDDGSYQYYYYGTY